LRSQYTHTESLCEMRGARYLTRESLKVSWIVFSTLIWVVLLDKRINAQNAHRHF
jgi:hypothetical protein